MAKKEKSVIGKYYCPFDNSYCINCSNNKSALIVQRNEPFDRYYYPNKEEDGAIFTIVSEPYEEIINSFEKHFKYIFIKVKSSLTGNIYRTLYNKSRVI